MTTPIIRISHYPRADGPLPEGARWVGRPSRWGNPFVVARGRSMLEAAQVAVDQYEVWLNDRLTDDPDFLEPLAEATALACACPLDQPCHVDVLIAALRRIAWHATVDITKLSTEELDARAIDPDWQPL